MVSFFEHHGLPLNPGEYGADRELCELASGLQRERRSLPPGFVGAEPPQAPPTLPAPAFPSSARSAEAPPLLDEVATGRHRLASGQARWLRPFAWAGAIAVLALLSASLLSYQRASSLEARLEQARLQQRSADTALTKLEQRAVSLQGALKQSEAERELLTTRFEAIVAEEAKRRASEEQALEQVLGARYRKLRQKLVEEAVAATP
jgi:hypothetical protein